MSQHDTSGASPTQKPKRKRISIDTTAYPEIAGQFQKFEDSNPGVSTTKLVLGCLQKQLDAMGFTPKGGWTKIYWRPA